MANITAPAAIADNGWVFYEKCRCQYVLKYKYRNKYFPGYELHWHARQAMFRVEKKGNTIVPLMPVRRMDQELKQLQA